REVWLKPWEPFEASVAAVRSIVESRAPCSSVFLVGGGFRWLSVLLMITAMALNSVGSFVGVNVEKVRVEIEEEAEDRAVGLPASYIEIPVVPKLADITAQDYVVLRAVAERGRARVKSIAGDTGLSRTAVVRRLKRLLDLGLLRFEARGKGYLYSLTPSGVMLAYRAPRE
ncbi:MAG: CRISPR-associated CARF protein Csa3, partial [Acidilobaceae archaeon]